MQKLNKINITASKLWLAAILMLAFLVFTPALKGAFLEWDDTVQVPNNPDIQNLSPDGLRQIFSSYYAQMYQPLASLSFALEYRAVGLQTWLYHLDNIFLHCLNILLVFWLTKKLFRRQLPALWAAALFAVWPTQVEAVAWISARSTLIASGFLLACLLSYIYYLDRKAVRFYFLALLFFVLALLSKSVAAIIPLLLWLLDYWKGRKFSWRMIAEKIPYLALAIVFGLVAIAARKSIGTLTFSVYNWTDRIVLILYAASVQAYKALLPFGLHTYYQHPADNHDHLYWWVYLAALLPLLGGWLVYLNRQRRWLVFGAIWFALNIILSIQLAPYITIAGADRYNYLALLAIVWLIAFFAGCKHWSYQAVLATCLMGLALASWNLSYVWQSEIDLWQNVINNDPLAGTAYMSRGSAKNALGDPLGGIDDLDIAIVLSPNLVEAYNIKGVIEMQALHRYDWAARDFNQAVRLRPDSPVYFYNRGLAMTYLNSLKQAIADYSQAVRLESSGKNNPSFLASANYSLAVALKITKNNKDAEDKAMIATTLDPLRADAWYLLGALKNIKVKASGCPEIIKAASLNFEPARAEALACAHHEK
ncbi:MAG: hypothetical protein WCO55_01145 [Candidatus Falkowbacteria bacterium]